MNLLHKTFFMFIIMLCKKYNINKKNGDAYGTHTYIHTSYGLDQVTETMNQITYNFIL